MTTPTKHSGIRSGRITCHQGQWRDPESFRVRRTVWVTVRTPLKKWEKVRIFT
jgi:hypothetical protein